MRKASLSLLALTLIAACGGAKLDTSSAQYSQVQAMAAQELRCPEDDVSVKAAGESRVVARGCDRVTDYVYTCRKPGPHEREYLTSTPVPPTDEAIEAIAESGKPGAEEEAMAMRQKQLTYSQGLVAIRLEDLQGGFVQGMALRHELSGLPRQWLDQECRYMHEE